MKGGDVLRNETDQQRILIAAFDIISSKGYANVSTRDIADKAGVVLSQLNYYFTNKEGLFKEVVRMMISKYLIEIEISLTEEESPKKRIESLVHYFRKMLKFNPGLFRLLYEFTSLALWSPVFGELLNELFEDLSNLIEKHITSNLQIKELKGCSTKTLSRLILGAMFGTGIQVLLNHDEELPDSLNAVQVLFD
jgi:AcrR family transcriptional regulator